MPSVALVILHADPARGGAERYTWDLAGALAARAGWGVRVLASSFPAQAAGVPWSAETIAAPGASRSGRYAGFLRGVSRRLAEAPADIVHAMLPIGRCDVYHPHAGLAAEALATGHRKHARAPMRAAAWVGNQLNRRRRAMARVERRMMAGRPVVLCLSDYVKASVRRWYPLPEDRLARLFNAVDLSRFDPDKVTTGRRLRAEIAGADDGTPLALMIAQDFGRKGLATAIAALAERGGEGWRLAVVGRDEAGPYRRLAGRLGVGGRVVFVGPSDDPAGWYAAADLFVLPTRHDPCSLVVLEALAMGLPVITTRYNGAAEAMTNGVHGQVLGDPGDAADLARALGGWAASARRAEGRAACLSLRAGLSFEAHVDRLLAIYQGLPAGVMR